jgi:DNA recombination protein RmuC
MSPFYILFAIALGCIIGWLIRSLRTSASDLRIEQLAKARAELSAERETLAGVRSELVAAIAEAKELQQQVVDLQNRNGELEAEGKFLNERLTAERQQVEKIQEKFHQEFEAISNKLLVDSSSKFDEQSKKSLENVLEPLKQDLNNLKTTLNATRTETQTHSDLLKAEVTRIGAEAANLSKALKGDAKILGNWGENMLDQILDKSGLQRGIHYRRQEDATSDNGDQRRLDVVVDLPDKRNLVIDSKVSLRNFEDAVNAPDEVIRQTLLEKHVDNIRKHFRDLGGKRYQNVNGINAPDFVLMYIPIEAAFLAAIAKEPGLFSEALEHNVVLITNSTLLATLRTVAHVWRLADQQKHVFEIADRGGKLYDKFVGFIDDLQGVGEAIQDAHKKWHGASNKLHIGAGNLVSQAEKLRILGAKASKALPAQLVEEAIESDVAHPPLPSVVEITETLPLPSREVEENAQLDHAVSR